MKNSFIILLSLVVGILVLLTTSCHKTEPMKTLAVSVLVDHTDVLELSPEKNAIYGLFHLERKSKTNVEQGVRIRVSEISSVDFNHTEDIAIPPVNLRKINIKERQKEINTFYDRLDKVFSSHTELKEQSQSSIFLPVCREAVRLSKLNDDTKLLILYTDLMEHSDWFNAYKQYTLPEEVLVKKFNEQMVLPDLTGIHMVLRYIPRNSEDNTRYRKLVSVYTKVFESKGATISFEF